MSGLDTNVLVRYFVGDDEKQTQKASACIRAIAASGKSCFISCIVLCELVWVLESAYDYEKREIVDVLEKLLITKQFEIENKDIVRHSIHDYKAGDGDIADHLIGRFNQDKGCDVTYTFDRALKGCPLFSIL
ncbi:MAG: type II toxin-antitoxin system VapC family toxin [Dissulfurispiraceae bacterium]|jgi:predicted nucleic-acid-binding protein